jgi:sRNA-binding regulator protein Hfq
VNRLKQIRERKSLTLAQVSARTSIPLRVLEDYEANVQEISPAHMKALSKALWVKPDEILLPAGVPPPAPSNTVAPAPRAAMPAAPSAAPSAPGTGSVPGDPVNAGTAVGTAAPAYGGTRPYTPAPSAYGAPRPDAGRPPRPPGPPAGGRGGGGRARREPVVMPATDGQITEIMRLAARLNLSTEEIEGQFGRSIDNITRFDAREWIKKLREDAIAQAPPAKVHFGQWPGLKDDREAVYLTEQRAQGSQFRVVLFNGEVFNGRIVDFTPYTITLQQEGADEAEQVILRKLAVAYYQRTAPGTGEQPTATGEAKEVAPFAGAATPQFVAPEDAGAEAPVEAAASGPAGGLDVSDEALAPAEAAADAPAEEPESETAAPADTAESES